MMMDMIRWAGFPGAGLERLVLPPEITEQQVHHGQNQPDGRSHPRGIMRIFGRGSRREEWSYHVPVHDYPTTIGTGSDHLSREVRYGILNQFDEVYDKAMQDLARTPVVDPDPPRLGMLLADTPGRDAAE